MTRYPCPLPDCTWFHSHMATPLTADVPTDLLAWTHLNWADMSERTGPGLAPAHVIIGHLVTHSPLQWMAMVNAERSRADGVTDERDRLQVVVKKAAFLTDAVDPLTTRRLPSRAEVEATRELLAGAMSGGDAP